MNYVLNRRNRLAPFRPAGVVYVGRPSPWGNPFHVGHSGSAEECVEQYRAYLMSNVSLLSRLREIRGKDLECWCSPVSGMKKPCHAHVLIELANLPLKQLFSRVLPIHGLRTARQIIEANDARRMAPSSA